MQKISQEAVKKRRRIKRIYEISRATNRPIKELEKLSDYDIGAMWANLQ